MKVVVGTDSGKVFVFALEMTTVDVDQQMVIEEFKVVPDSSCTLDNHQEPLTAVCISQDQSTVFSGTTGKKRIIWKEKVGAMADHQFLWSKSIL